MNGPYDRYSCTIGRCGQSFHDELWTCGSYREAVRTVKAKVASRPGTWGIVRDFGPQTMYRRGRGVVPVGSQVEARESIGYRHHDGRAVVTDRWYE